MMILMFFSTSVTTAVIFRFLDFYSQKRTTSACGRIINDWFGHNVTDVTVAVGYGDVISVL